MPNPIHVRFSNLRGSKFYEYAVRFILGGLITAGAGFLADHYGPAVGGLFLGFPAILPATATLLAKHEQEKKAAKGLNGTRRGRFAAALDTRGAAIGSIGLIAFAALGWGLLPRINAALALLSATVVWFAISFAGWLAERILLRRTAAAARSPVAKTH